MAKNKKVNAEKELNRKLASLPHYKTKERRSACALPDCCTTHKGAQKKRYAEYPTNLLGTMTVYRCRYGGGYHVTRVRDDYQA